MQMNFKGLLVLAAVFAVALGVSGCKTTYTSKSGEGKAGEASTKSQKSDDPAFKGY